MKEVGVQDARAQPKSLLSTFERLSPSVYLYDAPQTQKTSQETASATNLADPKLIIMCSWMGASASHISKYLGEYQARYPTSAILVVTSSPPDMVYRSIRTQECYIAPAVDVVARFCDDRESDPTVPTVLFQMMSNGGAYQAIILLSTYAKLRPGSQFPFYVTIFDSTPGIATFSITIRALDQSITPRNTARLTRMFITASLYVFIALWWLFAKLWRTQNLIQVIRYKLNDNDGLMSREARRGYVYSKADEMVPWQAVEDHLSIAVEKGINVAATEKLTDSAHCAHMRVDGGKRYWSFVQRLWAGR